MKKLVHRNVCMYIYSNISRFKDNDTCEPYFATKSSILAKMTPYLMDLM